MPVLFSAESASLADLLLTVFNDLTGQCFAPADGRLCQRIADESLLLRGRCETYAVPVFSYLMQPNSLADVD